MCRCGVLLLSTFFTLGFGVLFCDDFFNFLSFFLSLSLSFSLFLSPSEVTPPVGVVVGWVPFSRQTAKCAWDTLDGMGVGLCFSTSYKANCWHIPRGGTVVGPVWDPSPGGLEILFGPVAGSLVAQC
jgi:hypothetical protein